MIRVLLESGKASRLAGRCGGGEAPNQALEQTRDSVLRYGERVGCELLNAIVRPWMPEPKPEPGWRDAIR